MPQPIAIATDFSATTYRLSGWVKGHAVRGRLSFNDHLGRAETERAPRGDSDWTLVEVDYNSGNVTKTSINILHVAVGDGYFNDVKLLRVTARGRTGRGIVGLAQRGEDIFTITSRGACFVIRSKETEAPSARRSTGSPRARRPSTSRKVCSSRAK